MKENNEGLSTKQKHLIDISAFTSKSEVENLRIVLYEALDAGLTINE
jgi:alkylhydroperoxidase/carboxymuconolactone decarboxylase family protein YurZ